MPRKRKSKRRGKKHSKSGKKKNKLGVVNSLVNNINARRKKHISRPRKKKTVSSKSYRKMKKNWKK